MKLCAGTARYYFVANDCISYKPPQRHQVHVCSDTDLGKIVRKHADGRRIDARPVKKRFSRLASSRFASEMQLTPSLMSTKHRLGVGHESVAAMNAGGHDDVSVVGG